jgi:hypothetical protein
MPISKYGNQFGVEQQLRMLSKWLAEYGFREAAELVSAAAVSVHDKTHQSRVRKTQLSARPQQQNAREPSSTTNVSDSPALQKAN